jgi:pimeloyl-ACP methyl ester carboxylesterase
MKTIDATHRGRRISCRTGGKGEGIVFLHADFVDGRMWDGVIASLEGAWSTTAYDKLGYGFSDRAPGPLCRRRELADVLQAIGGRPAHLVGCSNGGQQALDYALERPDRVLSLCLVNSAPSGFAPEGEPPRELLEMLRASSEGRLDEVNELQTGIWFDGPRRSADSMDDERLAAREKVKSMNRIVVENGTFPIADMNPLDPLDPPAIRRLGELRVPVLVVSGELDYEENRRASRILAEGIPGARLVEMAGCAHVPPVEDPSGFARMLEEFLSSVAGERA